MSFESIKVGDEVVIQGRNVKPRMTTVTRVGRKYFYTGKEYTEQRFEISSGHGEHGWFARTPSEHRDGVRRARMERILQDNGIELRRGAVSKIMTVYNALKICLELPNVED